MRISVMPERAQSASHICSRGRPRIGTRHLGMESVRGREHPLLNFHLRDDNCQSGPSAVRSDGCSLLLTETGSSPRSRNCMTRVFMSSLVGDSVLSQQRDCSYQSIVAGETLLTYSRSLMNCSSFGSTVPPNMGSNAPSEIEEPLVNYCLL